MVIMLPKRQSFGEKIGESLGAGITKGFEQAAEKKKLAESNKLKTQEKEEERKHDFAKIAEDARLKKDAAVEKFHSDFALNDQKHEQEMKLQGLKSEKKQNELKNKQREKIVPFENALETLNDMQAIQKRGKLGRGSGAIGIFDNETAKDREEYSRLGKSLIQMATSIPIRNQKEFETLAEGIYDPSKSNAEIEGSLNAMEKIISRSIGEVNEDFEDEFADDLQQKELKELDMTAMEKIRNLSGGDKERAKKIAKKMGYKI